MRRTIVKPRLLVGIRYRLHAVVDLPALLQEVELPDLAVMMAKDWRTMNARGEETPGQACGRALFHSGAEAFLVPSARVAGAQNLVVFLDNMRRPSRQTVLEEPALRKWFK